MCVLFTREERDIEVKGDIGGKRSRKGKEIKKEEVDNNIIYILKKDIYCGYLLLLEKRRASSINLTEKVITEIGFGFRISHRNSFYILIF